MLWMSRHEGMMKPSTSSLNGTWSCHCLRHSVLQSVQERTASSQHGHNPIKTSFFAWLCWPEQVKCYPIFWPSSVLCLQGRLCYTLLSFQICGFECVCVSSWTVSEVGESSITLKKKIIKASSWGFSPLAFVFFRWLYPSRSNVFRRLYCCNDMGLTELCLARASRGNS